MPDNPSPMNVVHAFPLAMEKGDYETALSDVAENCEYANPGVLPTVYEPASVRPRSKMNF